MNDIAGARMKSGMYAAAGYVSSFMKFLTPSAAGCSSPCGPTRFGPCRSWIHARDLALGQREHRHADHVDGEDDEHLDDRREEPERRGAPAPGCCASYDLLEQHARAGVMRALPSARCAADDRAVAVPSES